MSAMRRQAGSEWLCMAPGLVGVDDGRPWPALSRGYRLIMPAQPEVIRIGGREVSITNPDKVFFARIGVTKRDLVEYYLAVADGALRGVRDRPMALKRFVNGAEGEAFFQKRAPESRPDWLRVATLSFPSGRTADEIVLDDAAGGGRGGGLRWI